MEMRKKYCVLDCWLYSNVGN